MDYLSRVIKETMRIFPIVACVVRHLKEDLKIGLFIIMNLDNFLLEVIIYLCMHNLEANKVFNRERSLNYIFKKIHLNQIYNLIAIYTAISFKIILIKQSKLFFTVERTAYA